MVGFQEVVEIWESLLVRATFGERVVGIFALQSGKRSSENGVQTTFGLGGKGSDLERPRACVPHTPYIRVLWDCR